MLHGGADYMRRDGRFLKLKGDASVFEFAGKDIALIRCGGTAVQCDVFLYYGLLI